MSEMKKGGVCVWGRQLNIYMILGVAGIILALQLLDQLFLFLLVELFMIFIIILWISKCFSKSNSRHK
jgi:energy-converting hydrogenase Eha subunit C